MTEQKDTIFALSEMYDDQGPRMGLGGWGLPGINSEEGFQVNVGPIMGYCWEKITTQFHTLRGMTHEEDALKMSLRVTQGRRPLQGSSSKKKPSRQEREALEAKARLISGLQGSSPDPAVIQADLDKAQSVPISDKSDVIKVLFSSKASQQLVGTVALGLLRSVKSKEELEQLIQKAGGQEKVDVLLHDINYGVFQCILENYGIVDWVPPFHHSLFTNQGDERDLSEKFNSSVEGLRKQIDEGSMPLVKEEFLNRFMIGDITASDLLGLTREELYAIAQRGYELLQQGQLQQALHVYDGLVYLDPYDPYFHTVLGSVRQRQEDLEGALTCYGQALRLQPWNINALANRGEILFNQGQLTEALQDFQQVIQLDPKDKNPSTVRVKTLVLALGEALQKKHEELQGKK